MPRGSNTSAEIDRVKSREQELVRPAGTKGIAPGIDGKGPGNLKGFGSGSMQKNKESNRKSGF